MFNKERLSVFTEYIPKTKDADKDKIPLGFGLQGDKDYMEMRENYGPLNYQSSDLSLYKSDKKFLKPISGFQLPSPRRLFDGENNLISPFKDFSYRNLNGTPLKNDDFYNSPNIPLDFRFASPLARIGIGNSSNHKSFLSLSNAKDLIKGKKISFNDDQDNQDNLDNQGNLENNKENDLFIQEKAQKFVQPIAIPSTPIMQPQFSPLNVEKRSPMNKTTPKIIVKNNEVCNKTDKICCNCTRSCCLKKYCSCFSSARKCENCECKNCKNCDIVKNSPNKNIGDKPPSEENKVPETITSKGHVSPGQGCNCTKSNCQKRYCECFKQKRKCSAFCKCIGCKNREDGQSNDNNEENDKLLVNQTTAKKEINNPAQTSANNTAQKITCSPPINSLKTNFAKTSIENSTEKNYLNSSGKEFCKFFTEKTDIKSNQKNLGASINKAKPYNFKFTLPKKNTYTMYLYTESMGIFVEEGKLKIEERKINFNNNSSVNSSANSNTNNNLSSIVKTANKNTDNFIVFATTSSEKKNNSPKFISKKRSLPVSEAFNLMSCPSTGQSGNKKDNENHLEVNKEMKTKKLELN